jgi:FkbM family methyltransferase
MMKNRPGAQVIHGVVHDKGHLTLQYNNNDGEENKGTSTYSETVDPNRTAFTVASYRLQDLLNHIDYMSVDTEGTEFSILSGFEAEKFEVDVIQTESPRKNKRQ